MFMNLWCVLQLGWKLLSALSLILFLQTLLSFPRIEWSTQAHFNARLVALFCGPLLQEQLITPSNLIHGSQSRAVPLQVNHYRCLCKRILHQTKQLVSHWKSSVSCDSTACNCCQLGPSVLWVHFWMCVFRLLRTVRVSTWNLFTITL